MLAILLSFLATSSFGQVSELMKGKWEIGAKREINGYTIIRDKGANNPEKITNISYMPLTLLIKEAETKADNERWTKEKLATHINKLNGQGSGGRVQIYLSRSSREWADASNFTLIIQDENEKEVYREECESKKAEHSKYWYNSMDAYIPREAGTFFYVYIIDEMSADVTGYKFSIRKNS